MTLSSIMGKQVGELQQTVQLSLLQSQLSTQAAQATVMLEKMNEASAPHPFKGNHIDVSR
jgi:putative salt-induced outer membrane protein YdiY